MSLPVDLALIRLPCDGSRKTFQLADANGALRYQASSHLAALHVATDGVQSELAFGTDFTVSGQSGAASLTTLAEAPLSAGTLIVYRNTPRVQGAIWRENDGNPSDRFETANDYVMTAIQDLAERMKYTMRADFVEGPLNPLKQLFFRSGYLVSFDADAQLESRIRAARLALAPDGDAGPALLGLAARASRLTAYDTAGNETALAGLGTELGIVTLDFAGMPQVFSLRAITGSDSSEDFDGGFDELPAGDNFDGGLDGAL